jgi:peptide deformylase
MILPIRIWGDPVLTRKARAVDRITAEERRLVADMMETMEAADGAGLAAPQVGVSKRIFVFRRGEEMHALINPKIVRRKGKKRQPEGCLSIPGVQAEVERAAQVVVTGRDEHGKLVEFECEDSEEQGRAASAAQHELDHLDGVLFLERAAPETISWLIEEVDEEGEEVIEMIETTPQEIQKAYKTRRLPRDVHIQPMLRERLK